MSKSEHFERVGAALQAVRAAQTAAHEARSDLGASIRNAHADGVSFAELGRHLERSRERVRQLASVGVGDPHTPPPGGDAS